jgi:hypothetical protein
MIGYMPIQLVVVVVEVPREEVYAGAGRLLRLRTAEATLMPLL